MDAPGGFGGTTGYGYRGIKSPRDSALGAGNSGITVQLSFSAGVGLVYNQTSCMHHAFKAIPSLVGGDETKTLLDPRKPTAFGINGTLAWAYRTWRQSNHRPELSDTLPKFVVR